MDPIRTHNEEPMKTWDGRVTTLNSAIASMRAAPLNSQPIIEIAIAALGKSELGDHWTGRSHESMWRGEGMRYLLKTAIDNGRNISEPDALKATITAREMPFRGWFLKPESFWLVKILPQEVLMIGMSRATNILMDGTSELLPGQEDRTQLAQKYLERASMVIADMNVNQDL